MKAEYKLPYREHGIIDEEGFRDMVATCAYLKFAERGFAEGRELQDWLDAEEEVAKRCFYWIYDTD